MDMNTDNTQRIIDYICEICPTQEEAESLTRSLLNLPHESQSDNSATD